MRDKYRSGFERLSRSHPETGERYATALEAVREHFSGFGQRDGYRKGRTLSDNQRKQIRRYYNILTEYTEGGPVYKMTPGEIPKNMRKGGRIDVERVMKAAQMPAGRKRAKYIFIKFDGESIPRIGERNGAPVFINDRIGYSYETIELGKDALLEDARAAVLGTAEMTKGAKFYRILNGRHEFERAGTLSMLANKIEELQQKYAIGTKDSWDRWLHGIAAYYSDTLTIPQIVNHISESKAEHKKRIQKLQRQAKEKRK